MGLFKPAWMTGKPSRAAQAIAALDRMGDQAQFAEVAWTVPLEEVALAAARRIDDERLLHGIASTRGDIAVGEAVAKLPYPVGMHDPRLVLIRWG